jgi:hypothetical protein
MVMMMIRTLPLLAIAAVYGHIAGTAALMMRSFHKNPFLNSIVLSSHNKSLFLGTLVLKF